MPFIELKDIVEDNRQGKMVLVCDDEDRGSEDDLTMAADLVAPSGRVGGTEVSYKKRTASVLPERIYGVVA